MSALLCFLGGVVLRRSRFQAVSRVERFWISISVRVSIGGSLQLKLSHLILYRKKEQVHKNPVDIWMVQFLWADPCKLEGKRNVYTTLLRKEMADKEWFSFIPPFISECMTICNFEVDCLNWVGY